MRIPRKGERGFTLIELLIVVAILGVLAAVVIPNVGRFFGRGEEEARRTEYHNISSAVIAMMVDNALSEIPNPTDATGPAQNQLGLVDATGQPVLTLAAQGFPDFSTAFGIKPVLGTEAYNQDGYVLYRHQIGYDNSDPPDGIVSGVKSVNYVNFKVTKYYYTCEADGTVRQWSDAAKTEEYMY